jgi:hypothetical protein
MAVEIPGWLYAVSIVALAIAGLSAIVIVVDMLAGYRQRMWIMNLVWPITALWSGPIARWAYFRIGRLSTHQALRAANQRGEEPAAKDKPFAMDVALAATHCGAGCYFGDIVAEWIVFFIPLALFGQKVFGTWALDYAFAFLFGIVFQYLTIKPMQNLSAGKAIVAALKADTLSLTVWQVGMYGWMAIVIFVLFGEIPKANPVFWFMMQIAMIAGFITSYPANWWLLKKGIKERM